MQKSIQFQRVCIGAHDGYSFNLTVYKGFGFRVVKLVRKGSTSEQKVMINCICFEVNCNWWYNCTVKYILVIIFNQNEKPKSARSGRVEGTISMKFFHWFEGWVRPITVTMSFNSSFKSFNPQCTTPRQLYCTQHEGCGVVPCAYIVWINYLDTIQTSQECLHTKNVTCSLRFNV